MCGDSPCTGEHYFGCSNISPIVCSSFFCAVKLAVFEAQCVVYSEECDHQLIHHCNLYLRCNMQISYHAIVLLFYRSNLISYKFCQIKTQHFLTGVEIFSAHTLRNRSSKFKEADLPPSHRGVMQTNL